MKSDELKKISEVILGLGGEPYDMDENGVRIYLMKNDEDAMLVTKSAEDFIHVFVRAEGPEVKVW